MNQSPRTNWLAAMIATLVGFGLLFAPNAQTNRLEALVHDVSLPGLRLLNRSRSWGAGVPERVGQWLGIARAEPVWAPSSGDHLSRTAALEETIRRLQSQNARLMEELEQARAQTGSPFGADAAPPLFVPELLEANVVAADDVSVAIQRASAQRIVDVGQSDGVVPADFVVGDRSTDKPKGRFLIDQGNDVNLHADQLVFAGRCVMGKVHQVGRWTSSVLPVTSREFRGRAQVMRQTSRGLIRGPEGIMAGDGENGCRLEYIAATEPVALGDEVYTTIEGTPLPIPMYYGRVVSAELPDGAPYWNIRIKPAQTMADVRAVQVLRIVLNPVRTGRSGPPMELP